MPDVHALLCVMIDSLMRRKQRFNKALYDSSASGLCHNVAHLPQHTGSGQLATHLDYSDRVEGVLAFVSVVLFIFESGNYVHIIFCLLISVAVSRSNPVK